MASPKVEKRYSKPAKVVEKKPADAPVSGDEAPSKNTGAGAEPSVTAGTEAIPVNERHASERTSMMDRQTQELKDMHKRHMSDLGSMHERHSAELGPGGVKPSDKKG